MNTEILSEPRQVDAPAGDWAVDVSRGTSKSDLSMQWMRRPRDQRFIKLSDLAAFKRTRYEKCTELRIKSGELELIAPRPSKAEDLHKLTVGLPGGSEVGFSNWSFGQVCGLAKAPAGHYRELPSQIVRDALLYRLRYSRDVEAVKTFADDTELFAVTGPDYGRIPDHDVVEAVMQIAGDGTGDTRWKVPGTLDWRTGRYDPRTPTTLDNTTIFGSDRDCFIFLVDDLHPIEVGKLANGEPDLMFRGFYVQNSEVGCRGMKLAAFYLRAVCCNRIMWGVEGFEELDIRHTKMAPDRFMQQAVPALQSFADSSVGKLADAVEKAKAARVADNEDAAIAFLNSRSFSITQAKSILELHEKEEGHPARSAWDMAQGITAFARSIPFTGDRIDVERVGGRILEKVAA